MKKDPRKLLALLLGIVLLVAAMPAVAAADAGSTLYSWTASTLDKDSKTFSSNLINNADAEIRWNDSGVIYTDSGKKEISVHSFLNKAAGRGSKAYGLPQDSAGQAIENLKVETYPSVMTEGLKAVNLSMIYAYVPASGSLNAAVSGCVQVYVSKNGMDWLEESVGLRSAQFLGTGSTGRDEQIIFYRLQTENLLDIDGLESGNRIHGVRIMPDGQTGLPQGQFGLCELALTGYDSVSAFEKNVPATAAAEADVGDMDKYRANMLEAAVNSAAGTEIGVLQDALSQVSSIQLTTVPNLLNTAGIQVMDGVNTKANDRVHKLFDWMYSDVVVEGPGGTYVYNTHKLDKEKGDAILAEYEKITTTSDIVIDLNTPQEMMRAYARAQAGDMIMQMVKDGDHAYMVVHSDPVYLADEVNVDPNKSTLTYLTLKGERTATYFDMFVMENFVPMTLTDLANGTMKEAAVEVHVTLGDSVGIAVVSNLNIRGCQIALGGFTAQAQAEGAGLVYTSKELDAAVAALADGKHQLTVTTDSGPGDPVVSVVELEVKGGKAAVVQTEQPIPDHSETCPAKAMTDVDKNAWYHDAVDYVLTNGIMGGYNATSFGPNDTLSRAMVVQVLYNKEGQPAISGKHDFTDVPADQWFNNAVTWGTRKGVMGGYGDGKFGPNDSVTIEQIAVILWNYAGNPEFKGNADSVGTHSGWAANGLAWAVENGVLDGIPYESVTTAATRAQTAQMLMNYLTAN